MGIKDIDKSGEFAGTDRGRDHPTITGTRHLGPPEWAGNVVAMTQHQGRIFIACQFGVFRLNDDEKFEPLLFLQPGGTDNADT